MVNIFTCLVQKEETKDAKEEKNKDTNKVKKCC